MDKTSPYYRQVALLVRALPYVANEGCFALREVPERMLSALKTHFTQQDFDFLMSFKRGEPDWNLAPESHIQNLPAVQWKLRNIGLMPDEKRALSLEKLGLVLTDWRG